MSIVNLAPGGRISLISHYAPGGKNVLLFHLASGGKNTRNMRPLWGRFSNNLTPEGSHVYSPLCPWRHKFPQNTIMPLAAQIPNILPLCLWRNPINM